MNCKAISRLFIAVLLFGGFIASSSVVRADEIEKPKNIILFISDGWAEAQIQATNYYMYGENGVNSYENFPVQTWMSTYIGRYNTGSMGDFNTGYNSYMAWNDFDYNKTGYGNVTNDYKYPLVTGSAAAATTMSTGEKTYWRSIGKAMSDDPTMVVDDNEDTENLVHITQNAQALGKATGVVTSVQLSHATPAGFAVHEYDRGNYSEIGRKMVYESNLDVIMGCGHPKFDNDGLASDNSYKYVGGEDTYNALVAGNTDYTYITDKADFKALTSGNTPKKVFGLAKAYSTLQNNRSGNQTEPFQDPLNPSVPSLECMTKAAVNVLDNNPNGFFLMVEGGAVDWAGHANNTPHLIEEQADFNNAVEAAVKWVEENSSWNETLIIVTGDHETGYLTGPNNNDNNPHTNPVINNGKDNMPGVKWNSGGHTNMLIPFYAKGPGAELFDMYSDHYDMVRGRYMDNTQLGAGMKKLMPLPSEVTKTPKNIVFMISDGWGKNHIDAANAYEGTAQAYEEFPVNLWMSNYLGRYNTGNDSDWDNEYNAYPTWTDFTHIDHNPTGSAAAASSMSGGRKSYYRAIGLDADGEMMKTLCEKYRDMGAASGVVTSVQLCHATPAAFVSHVPDRGMYSTITDQIVYDGYFDVVMGCGHPLYDNDNQPMTPNHKYISESTWNDLKAGTAPYTLIDDKSDFQALKTGTTPGRVFGVPQVISTLQHNRKDGNDTVAYSVPFNDGVPSLACMTAGALNVLDNNENGFFLMVEGGAVDWAGHGNNLGRMIEEQSDFNRSVEEVIKWVEENSSWDETLLIVTGDHETGHLTGPNADDNNPFTNPVIDNGKGNMPSANWHSGSHTNQLIPFYAKGAGASLIETLAGNIDPVCGRYISNTEMATTVNQLGDLRYELTVNSRLMDDMCQNTPFDIETSVDINGRTVNAFVTGGSGDYSYYWTPESKFMDNTVATPVVKGLFSKTPLTCRVTDNETGDVAVGTVTVDVNENPYISIKRVIIANQGDEIDLESMIRNYDEELTYTWEDADGTPVESSVIEVEAGIKRMYVAAVNENTGCEAAKVRVIVYGRRAKAPFATEDIVAGEAGSGILIAYPSPVVDNLNLEILFDESTGCSVEILDINGRRVKTSGSLSGNEIQTQIDCSNLTAGTYFVVVNSHDDTIIKQIIKM